jgi:hypothetical protein
MENNISDIIKSESFQIAIKKAIEEGAGVDYYYDGEDENRYETFDPNKSLESVIRVLNEYLIR